MWRPYSLKRSSSVLAALGVRYGLCGSPALADHPSPAIPRLTTSVQGYIIQGQPQSQACVPAQTPTPSAAGIGPEPGEHAGVSPSSGPARDPDRDTRTTPAQAAGSDIAIRSRAGSNPATGPGTGTGPDAPTVPGTGAGPNASTGAGAGPDAAIDPTVRRDSNRDAGYVTLYRRDRCHWFCKHPH